MASVRKKLVCIICLKRFTLNGTDNEESLSGNENSYTKFLLLVSRYFKLKTLTDRFLESAKQAKVQNGGKANLHAFCDSCGELVKNICKVYRELQVTQMFLVWKLSEVGELLKTSTKSVSYKLSRDLLSCMAKQINLRTARPVDLFRKSLQLKCIDAKRNSMPILPIFKGLFPDEWKFTYSATKDTLIRLIVVFAVGSEEFSKKLAVPAKTPPPIDAAKFTANEGLLRPKRTVKSSQEEDTDVTRSNTDQNTIKIEKKEVKVENVDNIIDDSGPSIVGGGVDALYNSGNTADSDNDCSRGAPSPMSVADAALSDNDKDQDQSKVPSPKTKWNLRTRRKIMVKAEEEDVQQDNNLEKAKLECSQCSKVFKYRRALSCHLLHAHKIYIQQPCQKCGILFKTHADLQVHMKQLHTRHYQRGKSSCLKCSLVFPTRTEMWLHFKKEHKVVRVKKPRRGRQYKVRPFYTVDKGTTSTTTGSAGYPRYPRKTPKTEKEVEWLKKWENLSCSVESCGKSFRRRGMLIDHLESVHETEKSEVEKNIYCCYCPQHYAYQQTHDLHLWSWHKSKIFGDFKCDLEKCENDTIFISKDELKEHLKTHLEEISFCEKCNWGFMRPEVRDLHQLVHITACPETGLYRCPGCSGSFGPNLYHLQAHFNKMHGLDLQPFKCDLCGKGYFVKFMLDYHKKKHTKKPKFLGMDKVEIEEVFKCEQCGATFLDKSQFEQHVQERHDPRFLLSCSEAGCDLKFNTMRKLQIHITMKHVGVEKREWICELCAAGFPNEQGLKKHMGNHGERKYCCDICGARFKRKDKLPLHMDSKHNPNRVKSWVCSECGKSYHSDTGLQYHTDSEHKPESEWHLKCPHCPKRFYRNMYLYRHLKICKEGEIMGQGQITPGQGQGQVRSKMESMDTFV